MRFGDARSTETDEREEQGPHRGYFGAHREFIKAPSASDIGVSESVMTSTTTSGMDAQSVEVTVIGEGGEQVKSVEVSLQLLEHEYWEAFPTSSL